MVSKKIVFLKHFDRKSEQFCTVWEEQMSDDGCDAAVQGWVLVFCGHFWRSCEHLHNSVHRSNGCLDVRLDCFSRDGWVDSYSSCLCRGVARLAFHPRQTW